MITEDAMIVLEQIAASPAHGAARGISKAIGFGRDKTQAIINELRDKGLVVTKTYKTGIRSFGKVIKPTEQGYHVLKIRTSIQQSLLNSNLTLNAYSFISKKEYIRERMETHTMSDYEPSPMYLEPEERAEYARRRREQQSAEFRAHKEAEALRRIQEKKSKTPEEWTSDDSVYHFAERMALNWRIKPWHAARTRFKAAFGHARKTWGTTGDVELKMMDRFFETLEHESSVDDPEIVWKMFIKQFPSLLTDVNRTTVTDEDIDKIRQAADKQWENF